MASPDYLRERGTPTMPSDLAHHSVIIGPAHLADFLLPQGPPRHLRAR